MTRVRVEYFGPLREQAGRDNEALDTDAASPMALYAQLQKRYGFTLSPEQIIVSLNERISREVQPLQPDDCIVFIPPIAGG